MFRPILVASALALLSACGDGQPLNFGADQPVPTPDPVDPTAPPPPPTPAEQTQGNIADAIYNPGSDTLRVDISSLDSTPQYAAYRRDRSLDVGPYRAFTRQEDPLDRLFIGYARQVQGVEGTLAMDGGQFSTYYGGVHVEQTGPYSPHRPGQPRNGLVSYAGDYVGILNLDIPDGIATDRRLPVPRGTSAARVPGQSVRIDGEAFLNADFTNNEVNGVVDRRRIADPNTTIAGRTRLVPIFLIGSTIEDDGSFGGVVRLDPRSPVGAYSGVFGGQRAAGIAGGVFLDGDFISQVDGENEYGLFVLRQCGRSGDGRRCAGVNP